MSDKVKTCLDETGNKIVRQIYQAVVRLEGSPCLLAAIGSWGDTLDDTDVLDTFEEYAKSGECVTPLPHGKH